ncbi:hypothetical protein YC2023_079278 [Brassica napus]
MITSNVFDQNALDQIDTLLGTPIPVRPGSEIGFKSSYLTTPAPARFFRATSTFLSSITPSRYWSLPLKRSYAA